MRGIDSLHLGSKKIYNILLAEDDEDDFFIFNYAVCALLGQVQVLHTSNGVMFSSMIQTQISADIIFLDINMPYKNGITCLKEIRSSRSFENTRVIMYSTSNHKKQIESCYELGANFYLVKPSELSLIKLQIKDLLENDYFKLNLQPPLQDGFLMNYQQTSEKKFRDKLVA